MVYTIFRWLKRASDSMDAENILDNLVDTFYRTDVDGRITFMSKSVETALGYTNEELLGQPMSSLYVDPSDRQRFIQALDHSGAFTRGFEAQLRHKDGHPVWVASSSRVILDESGQPLGVEGIARDISAAKSLELSNTWLGRIIENSLSETLVLDAKTGKLLLANKGARQNLGYDLQELSKIALNQVAKDFDFSTFDDLTRPLRKGELESVHFHTKLTRKDGSSYAAAITLQLAAGEQNPTFVANIQDLTEDNRLTAQLLRNQKLLAMNQLGGGIAHDFNNLLMVMQGNLELWLTDQMPESAIQHAKAALHSVHRATELTQRLLTFAQRKSLRPQIIDISHVVLGMSDMLQRTLGDHISVSILTSSEVLKSNLDEGQLENAILNLCLNARDAMTDGGDLTITIYRDETAAKDSYPNLCVSVADSGIGMSSDIINRIFEPFFSTKQSRNGTGLGLSMVWGFIQQSKGEVVVDSTPEQGTCVSLRFVEALGESARVIPTTQKSTPPKGHEKVLLVEDHGEVAGLLSAYLASLGYEVHTYSDGVAAIKSVHEGLVPAVVLTDIGLPGGLSGHDVAAQVLQQLPKTKIVTMSGRNNHIHGSQQYVAINKPFALDTLAHTLRSTIDE